MADGGMAHVVLINKGAFVLVKARLDSLSSCHDWTTIIWILHPQNSGPSKECVTALTGQTTPLHETNEHWDFFKAIDLCCKFWGNTSCSVGWPARNVCLRFLSFIIAMFRRRKFHHGAVSVSCYGVCQCTNINRPICGFMSFCWVTAHPLSTQYWKHTQALRSCGFKSLSAHAFILAQSITLKSDCPNGESLGMLILFLI